MRARKILVLAAAVFVLAASLAFGQKNPSDLKFPDL